MTRDLGGPMGGTVGTEGLRVPRVEWRANGVSTGRGNPIWTYRLPVHQHESNARGAAAHMRCADAFDAHLSHASVHALSVPIEWAACGRSYTCVCTCPAVGTRTAGEEKNRWDKQELSV